MIRMNGRPRAATALVPCTCGELVQGILEGEPALVSCPIDRFSRVRATLGIERSRPSSHRPPPKALAAATSTLEWIGLGDLPLVLEVSCPLPPSKGFGSSTADVVGAIVATARAAGVELAPQEVARLAVGVEPSDGTMFPGLALFAHRIGRLCEELGSAPPLLVVVLDFDGTVDTLEYNATLDLGCLRTMELEHREAFDTLRRGLGSGRLDLVGRAATLSARANQRILPKPELERTIALGMEYGALGVCAAHSGTALGVIFGPDGSREAGTFLAAARTRLRGLHGGWISRLVDGGARIARGNAGCGAGNAMGKGE